MDERALRDIVRRLNRLERRSVQYRRTPTGGNKLSWQGSEISLPTGPGGAEADPVALAALADHDADTTAVHGIANTADLPKLSAANAFAQTQTFNAAVAIALASGSTIRWNSEALSTIKRWAAETIGSAGVWMAALGISALYGTSDTVTIGYDADTGLAGRALSVAKSGGAMTLIKRVSDTEAGTGTSVSLSGHGIKGRGQKATGFADGTATTDLVTKQQLDAIGGVSGALVYQGDIDCSTNPNYPAADAGHLHRVSVAGKIGGASGPNVEIGDTITCLADGTASGTHAAVGSSWTIAQANIDGAVIGPASVTADHVAQFSGTTGKLIKSGGALTAAGKALIAAADAAAQRGALSVPSSAEAILKTLIDAKGDLIVGSSDNTPGLLTVGPTNGHVLTIDDGESLGVKWAAPPGSSGPTDHGLVTSLPGSPGSGDRCTLTDSLTAPTWRWQLLYNGSSASTYKWEVLGGSPLFAEVATAETSTSAGYVNLATTGPSITVPLAGDYEVFLGAWAGALSGTGSQYMSYAIGATAASDADAAGHGGAATGAANRPRQKSALAASTALVAKYKTSAGTGIWSSRWMRVMPVRVG